MYGLSHYLMALQEVEKARLEERAEKERRDSEPYPVRHNPPSGPGHHDVRRAPRR
jgi:hypothetical protein